MLKVLCKNHQSTIYGLIKILGDYSKVTVSYSSIDVVVNDREIHDINMIHVQHEHAFVPDFRLEWCPTKKHFRVYILLANRNQNKTSHGYCILTIKSRIDAINFIDFYGFIYRNRANNKEAAYEVQALLSLK